MEVLVEEELKIMKQQAKEYAEIRNAELIEAQRFEAAEQRVKEEIDRRRIQQKARKMERRLAHEKHVSRVIAKRHMFGIRENAIMALHEMGLMQPKVKRALAEDVLPWLMSKTQDFLNEDAEAIKVAKQILEDGIVKQRDLHGETLR